MNTRINAVAIPRSLVLPVVFAISYVAFLLGGISLVLRTWFVRSFDWLDSKGVGHADIDVLFRHAGFVLGIFVMIAPVFTGAVLLRRSESRTVHVAWFIALSIVSLTAWTLWVALVLQNTYIALFTR